MTALSIGTQSFNSNHPPALEGFIHVLHQCILPNRCCHPGGVIYHLHSSDSQTTVSTPWSSITLPRAHHHRCSLYRISRSKVTPLTSAPHVFCHCMSGTSPRLSIQHCVSSGSWKLSPGWRLPHSPTRNRDEILCLQSSPSSNDSPAKTSSMIFLGRLLLLF